MAIEVKTTYTTNTITADSNGAGGKGIAGRPGTRNDASVQGIFAGSPLPNYSGATIKVEGESQDIDYSSPNALKAWFIDNVVKGTVTDGSFGLSTYDREFGNRNVDGAPSPPNLNSQAQQVEGPKPANGFVPNPASPGEGSVEATTKPDAPEAFVEKLTPNGAAFAGDNIEARADLKGQAKQIVDRLQVPSSS